jgi:DNA-binding CsgD family transcriptional regulator
MTETLMAEALTGRFATVTAVVDCLLDTNGPGALILGDAGIGKTALANAVIAELGDRVRHYRAYAAASLSEVPYAALAPLLTALAPGQTDDPRSVLKALVSALKPSRQQDQAAAVLVVEDAHYLDDSSAAVIAQLAAAEEARVVLLCRPHPSPPAEVLSMWSEGLLDRFELPPLTPQEVDELCTRVLGAPLVPSASAVLARASGGNPMYLLELIGHSRSHGRLVRSNDTWVLLGEPGAVTFRLTDLVRNQVAQLSQRQREALEAVALAEAIPLDVLQNASDSRAVDELTELQFITVASDQARHVRLVQPLIGEVIRKLIPTARSMMIRRRIVELMGSRPETLDGRLRHVTWALESGAHVSDVEILEAAQLANRLFVPKYVARVVDVIRDPSIVLAAQVALARAKMYDGDLRGAEMTLDGVVQEADDLQTVRQATMLGVQLAGSHKDAADQMLRAANDWATAVARLAAAHTDLDDYEVEAARLGSRLVALQAMQAAGCHAETESELQQIWDSARDDETRMLSGTLLAEALTVTGRPVSALQILLVVQDVLASCGDERLEYAEFVMRRYLFALLHAGELTVLDAYIQRHIDLASNSLIYFGGLLHLAAGSAGLRRGAVASAFPTLSQAAEVLQFVDIGRDLPDTVAAAAYSASLLKRQDIALSDAEHFEELTRESAGPSFLGRAYAVAARVERSGTPAAVSHLLAIADEARGSGALMFEVEVLSLALSLGELSVVNRLAVAASNCEGRSAEIVADFCRALTSKDANGLMAMSEAAAQEGLNLFAAECAGHALRILESRGDKVRQFEAQKLVRQRTAALSRSGALASDGSPDLHKLTRREREIASLVHDGASNRDIAVRLGLSLRTVEGHLYRMFAKLGISHREELAAVAYGTPAMAVARH